MPRAYLRDFPGVGDACRDLFVAGTESLSVEEHVALRTVTNAIGTEPTRIVLDALRFADVSPEGYVGLVLCELFLNDENESLERRKIGETLGDAIPSLRIVAGGREVRLPKTLSGEAGLRRLKDHARAFARLCLGPIGPVGREVLDRFSNDMMGRSRGLARFDIALFSLRETHPFFDEMAWARAIPEREDRAVAEFVTVEKYHGKQNNGRPTDSFIAWISRSMRGNSRDAWLREIDELNRTRDRIESRYRERAPDVRRRHPFARRTDYLLY